MPVPSSASCPPLVTLWYTWPWCDVLFSILFPVPRKIRPCTQPIAWSLGKPRCAGVVGPTSREPRGSVFDRQENASPRRIMGLVATYYHRHPISPSSVALATITQESINQSLRCSQDQRQPQRKIIKPRDIRSGISHTLFPNRNPIRRYQDVLKLTISRSSLGEVVARQRPVGSSGD